MPGFIECCRERGVNALINGSGCVMAIVSPTAGVPRESVLPPMENTSLEERNKMILDIIVYT
jgi:hypothetical protein